MKIIFLCSESFTSFISYRYFLRRHKDELAAIFVFPYLKLHSKKKIKRLWRTILKSSFLFLFFKLLTVKIYCLVASLYKKRLKNFAKQHHIPYFYCPKGITNDVIELIRKKEPDIIFNASAIILKKDIINVPEIGVLNFHGAKLPEFRGAANYFWVLVENCKETCATIHFVEKKIDTGNIISYGQKIKIIKGMSVFKVYFKILLTADELLEKCYKLIRDNKKIESILQNEEQSKTRSFPKRNDIKKLYKNQFRFITIKDYKKFFKYIKKY